MFQDPSSQSKARLPLRGLQQLCALEPISSINSATEMHALKTEASGKSNVHHTTTSLLWVDFTSGNLSWKLRAVRNVNSTAEQSVTDSM